LALIGPVQAGDGSDFPIVGGMTLPNSVVGSHARVVMVQ